MCCLPPLDVAQVKVACLVPLFGILWCAGCPFCWRSPSLSILYTPEGWPGRQGFTCFDFLCHRACGGMCIAMYTASMQRGGPSVPSGDSSVHNVTLLLRSKHCPRHWMKQHHHGLWWSMYLQWFRGWRHLCDRNLCHPQWSMGWSADKGVLYHMCCRA